MAEIDEKYRYKISPMGEARSITSAPDKRGRGTRLITGIAIEERPGFDQLDIVQANGARRAMSALQVAEGMGLILD